MRETAAMFLLGHIKTLLEQYNFGEILKLLEREQPYRIIHEKSG